MKTINPLNPQDFPMPDDNQPAPAASSSPSNNAASQQNQAADLIRQKLNSIYSNEPDVISEAVESVQEPAKKRSKHQKFMADLAASGKSFAEIQTAWHEYYAGLPDKEKHEVWNEFYSVKSHKPEFAKQATKAAVVEPAKQSAMFDPSQKSAKASPQTVAEARKQITNKVRLQNSKSMSRKQHLKSVGFGLSAGLITIVIMLFGFFNERFIAPFITPSKNVSSTPLIADGISGEVGKDPKLIIPKINVELPVVYDIETIEENDIQTGLERGVVHYPTTSNPGEQGNGVIFGHSSNNILNKGRYKFAFVLLSRLENGDTFYLEKDGVRYVYKIYEKRIVSPEEVSVLGDVPGKTSTMALITCDPPGTTINRLVVWGEQISPDPANNPASTALKTDTKSDKLAGNPDSLWSRIWSGIF